MKLHIKHLKCPHCWKEATLTSWIPPHGIDQRLHQFKCICRFEFYAVLSPGIVEEPVFPEFAIH